MMSVLERAVAALPLANDADPLVALRDIHLPPPVSHWPPAPGWWLLAASLLLLMCAAAGWLWWRRRRRLWRWAAAELAVVADRCVALEDPRPLLLALNDLLRRVALQRDEMRAMASAHGAAWQRFLMEGRGAMAGPQALLLATACYLPPSQLARLEIDRPALVAAVRRWLKENG